MLTKRCRVEATKINHSLLMLGIIISKLGQKTPPIWLPFRNSNLTRLLQQSFGGNSRTILLGTINPSAEHAQETEGTLRFAARAMEVENVYAVNQKASPAQKLRQLRQDTDKLMAPVLQRRIIILEKRLAQLATEVLVWTLGLTCLRRGEKHMANHMSDPPCEVQLAS